MKYPNQTNQISVCFARAFCRLFNFRSHVCTTAFEPGLSLRTEQSQKNIHLRIIRYISGTSKRLKQPATKSQKQHEDHEGNTNWHQRSSGIPQSAMVGMSVDTGGSEHHTGEADEEDSEDSPPSLRNDLILMEQLSEVVHRVGEAHHNLVQMEKLLPYVDGMVFNRAGLAKAALAKDLLREAFMEINQERLQVRDGVIEMVEFLDFAAGRAVPQVSTVSEASSNICNGSLRSLGALGPSRSAEI